LLAKNDVSRRKLILNYFREQGSLVDNFSHPGAYVYMTIAFNLDNELGRVDGGDVADHEEHHSLDVEPVGGHGH